ncbi:MAG TPA: glutamine--fructose-6-phosphate transaminase (isomerizing) [Oscillospiraceae bacterium]|mgnify:CR=1 FL=1|nr:glutamine--fructose-6-phosphate transaminase (isomerizing) [Oscillospiraceae bacterium]HNW04107.1 glutamine--fructose-6-phosphate transaminase (isomerizing) [Oscillospiraceae bacterium]HPW00016.1 glutamine--fructose-6-phosphate transaminase (isomerizing) [Oscillospiraceae bacterium]
MCGIIGFTGAREAAPVLLEGLKRLEYRGYDSAGIAVQADGGIRMVKISGVIKNLCEKTNDGADLHGASGIAHTRWATHGAPTDINAHPHLSKDGRFAVIQNGIIENFAALREELREKGYEFLSDTDTEVIPYLLDHYYTGDFKAAVMKTAARLQGSYALGFLCADEPGRLYAVKEGCPLILGLGVGENFFASDVTALVSHTKNMIYLEEGEFAELTPETITVFDRTGMPVKKSVTRVVWNIEAAEKGGYEHFMLKEIMEQPGAVKSTIEPRIKDGRIALDDFDMTPEDFGKFNKILITGCGSAYHAGVVGKYVIESLCRLPVEIDVASELRYREPIVDAHTLLIVISQSGETADTIAALRQCKAMGAYALAVVNVVGSTIAKLADRVLYTHAGPEIAVATTKGYTTQLAMLCLIAVWAAEKLGKVGPERYDELVEAIHEIPSQIQRAIDLNAHVQELAARYHGSGSLFFIGRNIDYAACLEGSLKLKEISYLHSEAYPAGELKHGTIALVDSGRLVVALCCQERLFDKMMSNIEEVKARGATVLGVAMEDSRRIFSEADEALFVPRAEPLFIAAAEIVPLQLFAYYVAKENGCDIDKPRNLAKSVTVE